MRILIVDSGVIPAFFYGGTQRVIWYLGKELTKLGHEVVFLVGAGSTCDFARVIHIDKEQPLIEQIPGGFDVLHFNFKQEGLERLATPYIITMHGNRNDHLALDKNTVFVSRNHAERFGSDSYVYNGLDWDDYSPPVFDNPRNYFHFLGKAAWRVKNVKGAIDIIKMLHDRRLVVLGGKRFNINMGLRFTFSSRVSFYGMVGGEEKENLLNGSLGMLFPVRWHEPFGLGMIESLYYGCPVFGTPYGSLPELINSDVGYLSNSKSELVLAVQGVHDYSREVCHDYVVEYFNSKKMALAYLEKYQRVMNGEVLNKTSPSLLESSEKFLDWLD